MRRLDRQRALPSSQGVATGGKLGQIGGMASERATYCRHRFPSEIIGYAVWLYHVFSLSLRDVELTPSLRAH